MSPYPERRLDEVEELLRNAQLRDALDPLLDDSISWLSRERVPLQVENEFLESMLAWERAPILSVSEWFEPPLQIKSPEQLSDTELQVVLYDTIHKLFEKRIVLDFTDHLSDRQLYTLIYRDILPAQEKKLDSRGGYLHWDCSDMDNDPELWLRYYASERERNLWADDMGVPLPPSETPPFRRRLPQEPNN